MVRVPALATRTTATCGSERSRSFPRGSALAGVERTMQAGESYPARYELGKVRGVQDATEHLPACALKRRARPYPRVRRCPSRPRCAPRPSHLLSPPVPPCGRRAIASRRRPGKHGGAMGRCIVSTVCRPALLMGLRITPEECWARQARWEGSRRLYCPVAMADQPWPGRSDVRCPSYGLRRKSPSALSRRHKSVPELLPLPGAPPRVPLSTSDSLSSRTASTRSAAGPD